MIKHGLGLIGKRMMLLEYRDIWSSMTEEYLHWSRVKNENKYFENFFDLLFYLKTKLYIRPKEIVFATTLKGVTGYVRYLN